MSTAENLRLGLLNGIELYRDGERVALPESRKTRALLAFLALEDRPHRREHLCELFFEGPDDPRAALRWSLSKLRPLVGDALVADRTRVAVEGLSTDIGEIVARTSRPDASARSIAKAINLLQTADYLGELEGIGDNLDIWKRAEWEQAFALTESLTARLIAHPDTPPAQAVHYAEDWLAISPHGVAAADALVDALQRAGRPREAAIKRSELRNRFEAAGVDWRVASAPPERPAQDIRYARTSGGVSLAYAATGEGPPLVKAANWLTHLELDWDAPIWSPLLSDLARDHTVIRYDERGNGLSDWDVEDISQAAFVRDLETVVDAVGLERFPLLGISQGAAVSIEYAVRHPGRVSALILFGGYPKGWRVGADAATAAEREAVMTLTRTGWGQDNPAYRHIFSSTFMPSASPEQLAWFDDFQKRTTSAENAVRFLSAFGDIDVRHLLPQVSVPTLVLHARGDQRIPLATGQELAKSIPNARLVTLETDNHLLVGDEPAAQQFLRAVRQFLREVGS